MSPRAQLELGGLVARELRGQRLAAVELELDAHLEAEVHDARDLGLERAVARLGLQDPQVVRADERVAEPRDRAEEAHDERVRRPLVEVARRPGPARSGRG